MEIIAWAWTFDGDKLLDMFWNKNKPLPSINYFNTFADLGGWFIAIRMSNGQLVKVRRK